MNNNLRKTLRIILVMNLCLSSFFPAFASKPINITEKQKIIKDIREKYEKGDFDEAQRKASKILYEFGGGGKQKAKDMESFYAQAAIYMAKMFWEFKRDIASEMYLHIFFDLPKSTHNLIDFSEEKWKNFMDKTEKDSKAKSARYELKKLKKNDLNKNIPLQMISSNDETEFVFSNIKIFIKADFFQKESRLLRLELKFYYQKSEHISFVLDEKTLNERRIELNRADYYLIIDKKLPKSKICKNINLKVKANARGRSNFRIQYCKVVFYQ